MSNTTSEPSRIERDLDQTRARLGSHLSELQGRLSPGQVLDDLVRYFRGKEGADFGRSLLDSVRANPLPTALTGIGLTWLMASNPRRSAIGTPATIGTGRVRVYRGTTSLDQNAHDGMAARLRTVEQDTAREQGETEQAYADRLDMARGKAVGLARNARETADSFRNRIADALAGAKQAVAESASSLRDQAGDAASSLGSTAQDVAGSFGGAAQDVAQRASGALARGGQAGGGMIVSLIESPVLLGALGLAAGALLGTLLPQSDQEEAALGKIAGQARDTARGLAQDMVDRGGNVTQAVLDAGRDSAKAQGLTEGKTPGNILDAALTGDLASSAKQVAQDVLRTGDEAIRKES